MQLSILRNLTLTALLVIGCSLSVGSAEEGRAAVFVTDGAKNSATLLGKTDSGADGEEILALASGPKGSTVVIAAFDDTGLHNQLLPVVAPQSGDTSPARFPAKDSSAAFPRPKDSKKAELYLVVFPNGNPSLEGVVADIKQIEAAKAGNKTDLVMLLALELKKKLSNAIREGGVKSEGFNGALADLLIEEPTAKAAVSRTGTGLDDTVVPASGKSGPIPLDQLDSLWTGRSTALPIGLVAPGGIVHTIASTTTP